MAEHRITIKVAGIAALAAAVVSGAGGTFAGGRSAEQSVAKLSDKVALIEAQLAVTNERLRQTAVTLEEARQQQRAQGDTINSIEKSVSQILYEVKRDDRGGGR